MEESEDPGGGSKVYDKNLSKNQIKNIIIGDILQKSPSLNEWNSMIDIEIENQHSDTSTHSVDNGQPKNKKDKIQRFFSNKDFGPFIVYIESTEQSGNNLGRFNDLKIAKDIFNLNLKDVKKINNKGMNRIGVEFTNFMAANNFVSNKTLINKGYNIFNPANYVSCKGIVRGVNKMFQVEEVVRYSEAPIRILDAVRLNRKVLGISSEGPTFEPTNTILMTFEGTILPRSVKIYGLEKLVIPYISPVTQCFNCLRFGHTKKLCKSKKKCFNCGDSESHDIINEPGTSNVHFSCQIKCIHCGSLEHKSNFKKCPEYLRQKNIKQLMAYENLTYFDASQRCKKIYSMDNRHDSNNFILHPSDFPTMHNNKQNPRNTQDDNETISPSQRRTVDFNSRNKRSFQQTVSDGPKKRIILKGYDRRVHEEALYFPNSRPINYSSPQSEHHNNPTHSSLAISQSNMPSSALTKEITNNADNIQKLFQLYRHSSEEEQNAFKKFILLTSYPTLRHASTSDLDNSFD